MGDDNLMDGNFIDLDLNQQPNPPLPSAVFNEFETTRMGNIEDRIRQLEGVTARARLRHRGNPEQTSLEITRSSESPYSDRGVPDGINTESTISRAAEKGKGCKRDSSHLVAKALQMESEVKKVDKKGEGGSFYDCNVCLDLAKDPILTCCGHLFCWSCFYQVSDVDSTSKECPVCKGEVSDSTIIPIYGNGDSERVCETVNGLMIPPRPKARRVESVRQQQVTRRLSHVPFAEALRRIRMSISGGGSGIDVDSSLRQSTEAAGSRHVRIHQVSRVLSESAASLTSLSSALSNAERLVEDLETVINNRTPRSNPPDDVGNHIVMHEFGLQRNNQLPDSTVDVNATLSGASSLATDALGSSDHDPVRRATISHPVGPRYSLRRRRNAVARTPDGGGQDTGESRRLT